MLSIVQKYHSIKIYVQCMSMQRGSPVSNNAPGHDAKHDTDHVDALDDHLKPFAVANEIKLQQITTITWLTLNGLGRYVFIFHLH